MYQDWRNPHEPALKFVREGDTVYVRAEPQDASADSSEIREPQSLSLPASVTEIVWPKVHVVVSQSSQAPLPSFTVYAHDVEVGGKLSKYDIDDDALAAEASDDAQKPELKRLPLHSLTHETGCGKVQQRSGTVNYTGGVVEQLRVYAQAGHIELSAQLPLQTQLYLTPETGLEVAQISFLKQIQLLDLPEEKRAALGHQDKQDSDTPVASGCRRGGISQKSSEYTGP